VDEKEVTQDLTFKEIVKVTSQTLPVKSCQQQVHSKQSTDAIEWLSFQKCARGLQERQ
jgi:hypothetical protein